MDPIHLMTVFIAVGEEECLAAAARRLDLSPAAVTRAVGALEAQVGTDLLQRMTRNVRLTEAGRGYLEALKGIIAKLAAADQSAFGVNVAHRGALSVTASVVFGEKYVLPCISEYMHQFPEIDVSACFVDRIVNLVDEGQDVAVRIGRLPDSCLKSLAVGKVRRVMCASPAYLAAQGVPQQPADLRRHMIIARNGLSRGIDTMSVARERTAAKRLRTRLTVTSGESAIEAAIAGLGIARVMSYHAAPHLADGSLKIVLAGHEGAPLPVHVLHRQGKYGSAKVRNFIDLLVERLRAEESLH